MIDRSVAYDDRTDLAKLATQWNKIHGILDRGKEWSGAIVRAATAAEIAANIAIRKRFAAESQFEASFVNSLLVWANGLDGKLQRLIIPSEKDQAKRDALNKLRTDINPLNRKRNEIVHQGAFADEREAREIIEIARIAVLMLVTPWEPAFAFDPQTGKVSGVDMTVLNGVS